MDKELEKKLADFCSGQSELLPHMSPLERAIGSAILEYWEKYGHDAQKTEGAAP